MPWLDDLPPCPVCGKPYEKYEGFVDGAALDDRSEAAVICEDGHRRKVCGTYHKYPMYRCPKCKCWTMVGGTVSTKFCRTCATDMSSVKPEDRFRICFRLAAHNHYRCIKHLEEMGIGAKRKPKRTKLIDFVAMTKESQAVATTIDILIDKIVEFPNLGDMKADFGRMWKKLEPDATVLEAFDENYPWFPDLLAFKKEFTTLDEKRGMIREAATWLTNLQAMRDREDRRIEKLAAAKAEETDTLSRAQAIKMMEQFVSDIAPVVSTYVQDKDGREKIGQAIEGARDRFRESGRNLQKPKPPTLTPKRGRTKRKV